MKIIVSSDEKLRIGLQVRIGLQGPFGDNSEQFGLRFELCDVNNSVDLYTLIWHYQVVDEHKFMLKCVEYGIKFRRIS